LNVEFIAPGELIPPLKHKVVMTEKGNLQITLINKGLSNLRGLNIELHL